MPYTVVRLSPPDADEEARQVAVQLLRKGVALERVPRVPAEEEQNGWRYVWPSRDDAASAAEQLQRRTGGRWEVREIDAEPSIGPLTWIQVDATHESDGWVFALDVVTRMMIERRFPGSCRHRRVFVAVEADDDLRADAEHFEALVRQVLFLLTWLSEESLAVFGRFRVFEPQHGRLLLGERNPLAKLLRLLKPKRRWVQFSLRSFLAAVTVFCAALSLWIIPAEKQRWAVIAIEGVGGRVGSLASQVASS